MSGVWRSHQSLQPTGDVRTGADFIGSGAGGQALRAALASADSRLADDIDSLRGVSAACNDAPAGLRDTTTPGFTFPY